ncbi:MAG TPA: glycosyltransferase family 2 protein [Bacteroidales bacterium]|nr:glycosyltransferase family 2 protein [Bacteroidales bacterium]HPS50619.1 glycosyltransferase family 2 protein [Bacteroidales bacterium]
MEETAVQNPLISVVIPVKNGADTLRSCLDGIFRQTLRDKLEVIVIDSGSADGTLELLKAYPVKVHHLPPGEFNHGETRNLGVRMARGEFVVMTVQDATPATDDWLRIMLDHFSNPEVSAVCGQQIVPHDPDKNPLQWFLPAGEAQPEKICFHNTEAFTKLPGKRQHAYCNWDDVNAMYRKSAKEQIPFRKLMFSEDTLWAKDALAQGFTIVYDYRARVYHYHHQNFRFYFKRTYIILYQNYKFYNYIRFPKNPLMQIPQIVVRMMRKNMTQGEKIRWIRYNLNLVHASWAAALIFALNAWFRGIRGVESSQKYFVGYPPQGTQVKSK